jgi:hypothetical protein
MVSEAPTSAHVNVNVDVNVNVSECRRMLVNASSAGKQAGLQSRPHLRRGDTPQTRKPQRARGHHGSQRESSNGQDTDLHN